MEVNAKRSEELGCRMVKKGWTVYGCDLSNRKAVSIGMKADIMWNLGKRSHIPKKAFDTLYQLTNEQGKKG